MVTKTTYLNRTSFGSGRASLAAAVGVGVALLLSGCGLRFEDAPEAGLSVALRDGFVMVTNCGADMPGPIRVHLGESTGDRYRNFFEAGRVANWLHGTSLSSDPTEWSQVDVSEQAVLAAGEQLSVRPFFGTGGTVARFAIPQRGLPEDAWLQLDGTITEEACVAGDNAS